MAVQLPALQRAIHCTPPSYHPRILSNLFLVVTNASLIRPPKSSIIIIAIPTGHRHIEAILVERLSLQIRRTVRTARTLDLQRAKGLSVVRYGVLADEETAVVRVADEDRGADAVFGVACGSAAGMRVHVVIGAEVEFFYRIGKTQLGTLWHASLL